MHWSIFTSIELLSCGVFSADCVLLLISRPIRELSSFAASLLVLLRSVDSWSLSFCTEHDPPHLQAAVDAEWYKYTGFKCPAKHKKGSIVILLVLLWSMRWQKRYFSNSCTHLKISFVLMEQCHFRDNRHSQCLMITCDIASLTSAKKTDTRSDQFNTLDQTIKI